MSKIYNTDDNDNNNVKDENDEENEYSEMGIFLKNNFTIEDFLNYKETRIILDRNARWDFEKKFDEDLEHFYKGEVDYSQHDLSTMFSLEENYSKLGFLQAIVYQNIKPNYDLDIFYLEPILAKGMVESYDERMKENSELRLQNLRDEYKNSDNAYKKFNWGSKTYK